MSSSIKQINKIVMNINTIRKTQSLRSQNSIEKAEETVVIETGAKIHRANILARIVHSLSLYKMQWALRRIKLCAAKRRNRHQKLGLAINRIFRRSFHEHKFNAVQKLKQVLLETESHEIAHNKKIIEVMSRSSQSIIFIVLKAKRRQIIENAFENIRAHSIESNFIKRSNKRKALRKIIQVVSRNKKQAFQKLYNTRLIQDRRLKIKGLTCVLSSYRKHYLNWSFWKLRKNLLDKRKSQIESDIKVFESKISNANDPELQAIREKKEKLSEHLSKVQQERLALEEELNLEYKEIENRRKELEQEVTAVEQKKALLQSQIAEAEEQLKSPYSLEQIYECVYHNFLLYLHENKEKVYNKQQILSSLTYPLIPIEVSIDVIKQQNKVMEELVKEYIVMFGHKKVESPVQLPYEYLVKENQTMYKMLLTLLPQVESDRDDLRIIRDNLFKLNAKVTEVWGK